MLQRKYILILMALLFLRNTPSFAEIGGSSSSHSDNGRGIANNGLNSGFNGAGLNGFNGGLGGGGIGGFGGGGFGGGGFGGGGFGGGGFGGSGGAQYQPNEAAREINKIGQETIKGIKEQDKQFSQNLDKLSQSFMGGLDKLNPPDKTAETLQELTRAQEQFASQYRSNDSTGAIVEDIVKGIQDKQKIQEEQFQAVATQFTTPVNPPLGQQVLPSNQERLSGFEGGGRAKNPLATAMNAEPKKLQSFSSTPTGGSPLDPAGGNTLGGDPQRGFFKGSKPYNSPFKQ